MTNPTWRIRNLPAGIWVLLVAIVLLLTYYLWTQSNEEPETALVAIIVPDGMSESEPRLAVWLEAAREQGLTVTVVHLSSLVSEGIWKKPPNTRFRTIVLPDQVLPQFDQRLAALLQTYVNDGGQLLVCFDALSRGRSISEHAQLSNLVGVEYGLFDTLGLGAIGHGAAFGSDAAMTALQIPPGKSVPWPPSKSGQLALTTYQYGFLTYPHFVTSGNYAGKALLEAPDGSLLLGERRVGRGMVTFANLPLGDLKGRTDGLPLHAVLQRLAQQAGLPTLAATPGGVGGLVFNLHVDANTSLYAFEEFDRRGFFEQGPFSIHFTVGPDAHKIGDHAGMNLQGNQLMQDWIHRFKARGDGLGNHGGWVHDYFGTKVSEVENGEMINLLERNDEVLREVAGQPIQEYSAPLGNQPEWITQWLERRGVLGYYFTGNTGMAPTRSYRGGKLSTHTIWSFPILTLNQIASFEEAGEEKMSEDYMARWLVSLAEFSADSGTVRTFYSHPPGWRPYLNAIAKWFERTAELQRDGRFKWYTMEQTARFLNRRERVLWHVITTSGNDHIAASAPDSETLKDMTWQFPKTRYARPSAQTNETDVRETKDAWLVVAKQVNKLNFTVPVNPNNS